MDDNTNPQYKATPIDPLDQMRIESQEKDGANKTGEPAEKNDQPTIPATQSPAGQQSGTTQPSSSLKITPPITAPPPPPQPNKQGFFGRIFSKKNSSAGKSSATPSVQAPKPPVSTSQIQPNPLPIGKSAIITRSHSRLKAILLTLGILVVVLIAVFFIFFYRVQFFLSPVGGADRIVLDGKEVAAGLQKVIPGKHSVEIKKDGYVTYRQSGEYKINQRVDVSFQMIKATEPQLVETGAIKVMQPVTTTRFAYLMTSDGRIASVATEPAEGAFTAYPLTNSSYKTARKFLFSDDNTYAMVLDTDSVKAVSFSRSDALNQTEGKLALDATKISSLTWNTGKGSYSFEPNSKIIYDIKDNNGWDLMQADANLSKSTILMRIDPTRFASPTIDLSGNQQTVLIVGGEAGIFDIASRSYTKLDEGKIFQSGTWGPSGKYAIVIDANGESYLLKDNKLTKIGLKTASDLISWVSPTRAMIVSEGRPVSVDFDNDVRINYAEINGLKNANSAVVLEGRIFFSDKAGVKSAPLTENVYNNLKAK